MSPVAALVHHLPTRTLLPDERWRPHAELGAVAATSALHLAWPLTDLPRALLVLPLVAGWSLYVAHRARVDPDAVAAWGLRREGLTPTALATLAVSCIGLLALAAWGTALGSGLPPLHGALLLLVYPVWGLIQQLLVQGLVTANLRRLPGPLGHPAFAVLGSAALFGLVHFPVWQLMIATFALGLAFGPIWLRWRNLLPLAVAHGWLGAAIYYLVLQQDPVLTYFG